jgi:hypothetical protein
MYSATMPLPNQRTLDRMFVLMVVGVISLVLLGSSHGLIHAEGESITDLFRTKSFQGSWEVINKFNWVGWLMNSIISIFCLIGLCMVFYQRLITLLYLSSRALFDNVWDMKNSAKGNKFFGFGAMGRDLYNGNRGVGFDVIIGFFYGLLPNVRAYSDYNPDKMAYNLQDDDSVLTYMMKTAIPTVLLVFFFAIGYSGTLAKAYGVVVDALAAAADKAVDINFESYVNSVLSTGDSYKFTIGTNNTETGKLAERISRDIYGKVLSRMNILDTDSRLVVGKNVENWVWTNVVGGSYSSSNGKLQELARKSAADSTKNQITVSNDADVSALSYDLIVNNSTSIGQSSSVSANIKNDFLKGLNLAKTSDGSTSDNLTIHLIVRKDKISDANFFVVPKSEK